MKLTASEAAAALRDPTRRVDPAVVRSLADSRSPGLYAWFVDAAGARAIAAGLGFPLSPGLIYAGQAGAGRSTATLGSRVGGNHVHGSIRGSTFRLTLASALRSALALESDGERLTVESETRLTEWIRARLRVAVVAFDDRPELDSLEIEVLDRLDPPLNLAKRPPTPIRARLTELRRPLGRAAGHARTTNLLAELGRRPVAVKAGETDFPRPSIHGPTPEELALELGLPNAKSLRGYLRATFPRPASELWSRWGPLEPDVVAAVKSHFRRG